MIHYIYIPINNSVLINAEVFVSPTSAPVLSVVQELTFAVECKYRMLVPEIEVSSINP